MPRHRLYTSNAERQVLVDHDHRGRLRSVGRFARLARQDRVGGGDGVQVGLELFDQITGGHPSEQLPSGRRKAGVTSAAGPAPFLEQIVTNTHGLQCAVGL